jgi:hypothetical protein
MKNPKKYLGFLSRVPFIISFGEIIKIIFAWKFKIKQRKVYQRREENNKKKLEVKL